MLAAIRNFKKDALQQVQTKVVLPGDIFNLNEPKLSVRSPLTCTFLFINYYNKIKIYQINS
jgi:hypothetical protein